MAVKYTKDIKQASGGGGSIIDAIQNGQPKPITPGMGSVEYPKTANSPKHINDYLGSGIKYTHETGNGIVQVTPTPYKDSVGVGTIKPTNKTITETPSKYNNTLEGGLLNTKSPYIVKPEIVVRAVKTGSGTGSDGESGEGFTEDYPEYQAGNIGSGIESALGTQYSWDKKGADQADLQYQQDALAAKQEALANRQTIEQNSLQYQQQADMMKYANNQEAEKVGWTGGYVLDQNRQMEYLKASIQAQMYGAMELQKYGYDSALAAARLSYDLNQQQFAHQYYMDAVTVAMEEATKTSQYISAEIKDMMAQYGVAEEILNSKDATEADKERATQIQTTIDNWFYSNGLSKTGVQTLQAYESARSLWLQEEQLKWQKYMDETTLKQGAIDSLEAKLESNVNLFEKLDEEGNRIYNSETGSYETLDFSKMSPEQIIEYTKDNSYRLEQVYGYVDSLFEGDITNYISSAGTITNADGSTTIKVNPEKLEELIKDNPKAKELVQTLGGYEYTSKAGDSTVTINIDENGEINVSIEDSESTKASSSTNSDFNSQMAQATTKGTGVSVSFDDITNKEELQQFNNITVQTNAIDGNKIDDDFDVDIGSKNYDLDVDWKQGGNQAVDAGVDAKTWNNAQAYLKDNYGNPEKDSFVMYDGHLWFYSTKAGKWGYVQQNAGGKKLYSDLQTAASGQTPNRWEKGQQMTVTNADNGGVTQTLYGDNLTFDVQSSAIRGSGIDDDFDIDVVIDGQRKKNYDIDVDWEYASGWNRFWAQYNFGKDHEINGKKGEEAWNEAQNYLQTTYPNQTSDTFIIYSDYLWYYNASLKKWGYVQKGAGGKKLYEDLVTASKGSKPDRWK